MQGHADASAAAPTTIFRLAALESAGVADLSRLPFSLKILLENLLRYEDGRSVKRDDIEALARWNPQRGREREIAYRPARVLLQDFTGVPRVVDLAAMRDAMAEMGGDPGDQSAAAGRARHRPLGTSRSLRHAGRARENADSSSPATANATRF